MANYVQIVTYRKLPSGKKHYTENVIAESPVVAQDALKEAKGNIEIIDNKTTLVEVNNFENLVETFKIKGELLLHAQLLSCVHLISFEKGKLEISISGNTNNNLSLIHI